jgi:hypothetical protein
MTHCPHRHAESHAESHALSVTHRSTTRDYKHGEEIAHSMSRYGRVLLQTAFRVFRLAHFEVSSDSRRPGLYALDFANVSTQDSKSCFHPITSRSALAIRWHPSARHPETLCPKEELFVTKQPVEPHGAMCHSQTRPIKRPRQPKVDIMRK